MLSDKLASTFFTKKILFFGRFLAVFLYFCTLEIGTIRGYLYSHIIKVTLFILIINFLEQYTFYITTVFSYQKRCY